MKLKWRVRPGICIRRNMLGVGFLGSVLLASLAATPACAATDGFPSKPFKIFVPYPPGGGTDAIARAIGPKLSEVFGQPVIVDNRAGAGGTLGTALAARAPADGYNLLILNTLPHTSVVGLYGKLPYDPVKDFAGVGMVATTPYIFVVHPSVPAKNIKEFIALARSKPGAFLYGSAGVGSATHLVPELFKMVTNINMTHVPYKGGGPAISDLLGGHVQFISDNLFSSISNIKAERVRALAVTSKKRSTVFPDLPSVAESGYPDFEVLGQFGFVVPSGTPRDIVVRLNAALKKVMEMPEVIQQIKAQGGEPVTSTPEEFDAIMRAESAKWLGVIRTSGIKPE